MPPELKRAEVWLLDVRAVDAQPVWQYPARHPHDQRVATAAALASSLGPLPEDQPPTAAIAPARCVLM